MIALIAKTNIYMFVKEQSQLFGTKNRNIKSRGLTDT